MIEHDEAVALARRVLALRLKRAEHLPRELLGEHAWGLLLALFIADADGRCVTASQAGEEAGAPAELAQRWLKALQSYELVACPAVCANDHQVALSPAGIHAVEACMEDAKAQMATKG